MSSQQYVIKQPVKQGCNEITDHIDQLLKTTDRSQQEKLWGVIKGLSGHKHEQLFRIIESASVWTGIRKAAINKIYVLGFLEKMPQVKKLHYATFYSEFMAARNRVEVEMITSKFLVS